MNEPVSLPEAATLVREHWAEQRQTGVITAGTEAMYSRQLDTFVRFAAAHDVADVGEVTGPLVARWVAAPVSAASPGSRGRAGQPRRPQRSGAVRFRCGLRSPCGSSVAGWQSR